LSITHTHTHTHKKKGKFCAEKDGKEAEHYQAKAPNGLSNVRISKKKIKCSTTHHPNQKKRRTENNMHTAEKKRKKGVSGEEY
jgi:hypothetical protein